MWESPAATRFHPPKCELAQNSAGAGKGLALGDLKEEAACKFSKSVCRPHCDLPTWGESLDWGWRPPSSSLALPAPEGG